MRLAHWPVEAGGRSDHARLAVIRELTGDRGLTLAHRCPTCGATDHGAPTVVGDSGHQHHDGRWYVSASTAGGVSGLVLARHPVGFDLADPAIAADPDQADRATEGRFSLVTAAAPGYGFHHAWAALEALGKLDGTGLLIERDRLRELLTEARLTPLTVDGLAAVIAYWRSLSLSK